MDAPTTTERHRHTAEEIAAAHERLEIRPMDLELTTADSADSELGRIAGERVLSLKDAAELCGTTYTALRKRADRGSLRTVKRGNTRMVPVSELEREGLMPGAEERRLAERVAELERELAGTRLLAEHTESARAAEAEARDHLEAAVHEYRAEAATAHERLEARERELAEIHEAAGGILGPIRAWRRARALEATT